MLNRWDKGKFVVSARDTIRQLILRVILVSALLGIGASPVIAGGIIKNEATGTLNGVPLESTKAAVTLNNLSGNAVSSVFAELVPNNITSSSIGTVLVYHILPTINPGDTGMREVVIAVPAGYTNMEVIGVSINQAPQAFQCASPTTGQYCSRIAGQVIIIQLGKVATTLTPIAITFKVDTPTTIEDSEFTSAVDDTTTPVSYTHLTLPTTPYV